MRVMKIQLNYSINDLKEIDFMAVLPMIFPVIAVVMLFVLIALIDLYRHRKTRKNVLIWTIIILLVLPLGPIVYFIMGRKDSGRK
jgi:uncharacterized membrane protein YqjE